LHLFPFPEAVEGYVINLSIYLSTYLCTLFFISYPCSW